MKKILLIIFVLAIASALISGYIYFNRDQKPTYDFIVARRSDISHEVSVTGRVEPAESVNLAFEKSGKISQVYVKVGEAVKTGQILASLDATELETQLAQTNAGTDSAKAQLEQYRAALATEQAKLDELKRGTRPEEIQITETKVSNAQKSLADYETNLQNVRDKAAIDLANLYDDVKDILNNGYVKADDAINKQIDELFTDDTSANPQLTFNTSELQAKTDAENQRHKAEVALQGFKKEIDSLPPASLPANYLELDEALTAGKDYLTIIKDFLTRLNTATNGAVGLSSTTIAAHKTNVNTARTNINTAISNINDQRQDIATQKVTNQKNITSAETQVNDAKSTLANAQKELVLKKAGTTPEQITAQEAKIKQAEANIVSQEAAIKQAEANVQNIQAQIAKTFVRSPINGVVTKQDAKKGEIAVANTTIISLISASEFSAEGGPALPVRQAGSDWEVKANIPEADIAEIKINNPAKVTLDAYGNETIFEAEVIAIDPAETIIEGVATYKVTLQFTQEDARIKSGLTANIDILTEKYENVITIPSRTVNAKNGDKIVKRLEADGTIKELKVITGLRGSDGNIEILEGISDGDKIITSVK